jgi:trehalose synthase (ADP-glucose) (EC 2.4.1.-)
MTRLEEYTPIVGQSVIDDLRLLAERLQGKLIQHINSTAVGGGVAEILNRMVPLLKELGVATRWDVIKGGEQFFSVTKKFHNALHGRPEELNRHDFDVFKETSAKNIEEVDTCGDIVFVHDPQPIMLIEKRRDNKWLWRCHIDVSNPEQQVWDFLMDFLVRYDSAVFSAPSFSRKLPIRQFLIAPSIDPLSDKNKNCRRSISMRC